ncbi:osmotically inducible protein OsmC [Candidatus Aerophobetes bacterium]|uniref:Osmotically inducible protein OsmC n=1 Tax=Aerophobetes bacterium TaxID=2030807 RepID=A0A497E745_UNCAE|nr:MAG: osmotically inducible protein OsmC [Candidatus Aerophobetes bacterium]
MDMEVVFPGGKKVNAIYKGFTIQTDQPRDNGGGGSAPTPFDLFLASIGTCTGIYVLLFCQARHIPTDKIKLILRTERNSETKMITRIIVEIQLPPEFPEKYKEHLVRVAGKCSVKKHLEDPPLFNIYTKTMGK